VDDEDFDLDLIPNSLRLRINQISGAANHVAGKDELKSGSRGYNVDTGCGPMYTNKIPRRL
jgi:hypothetical protein